MNIALFIVLLLAICAGIYFILSQSLKKQLNMVLELDPPEVTKGHNVKVIVKLTPVQDITLMTFDGDIKSKKFDNYKGSWIDKNELPVISSGVLLLKTRFSFGENLQLKAGEERKFSGIIPIPDDAAHTEVRGSVQIRWFVTVEAKTAQYMPPAIIQEELIVLKPRIYDGEEKEKEGELDLYDPTYDLGEAERQVVVTPTMEEEVSEVKKEKVEAGDYSYESLLKSQVKKVTEKPVAKAETPASKEILVGERSEPLKTQYTTPFDPARKIMEDAAKMGMEIPPVTSAIPPEKEPEIDRSESLKVQYSAPFDPAKKIMEDLEKRKQVVDSFDYLYSMKGETEERRGPKFHKLSETPDEYKTRYTFDKSKTDLRMDTAKAPGQPKLRPKQADETPAGPGIKKKETPPVHEAPASPGAGKGETAEKPKFEKRKLKDKFTNIDKYTK